MVKNLLIMGTATTLEKHWSIDYLTTGVKKEMPVKEEIILHSINEEIKKRLLKINHLNTLNESLKNKELGESSANNFESPKFSPDFLIYDTRKYFLKSQKWIGHVVEIKQDCFIAKLTDVDNETTYEIGEFDYDEISPEDKEFLEIGGTFYWTLGSANTNGQIEKKSIIRFQRVNKWKIEDYDHVIDRANELMDNLKWE